MDKKISRYKEYCTGCGLCHNENNTTFISDNKGFIYPELNEKDLSFCSKVCPSSGVALNKYMNKKSLWGSYCSVNTGWATNESLRWHASSGGILSALACFLINEGYVEGVICTKSDTDFPWKTKTILCRSESEVLTCSGSRYASSAPLYEINKIINENETYCFIGKPCDVSALRLYMDNGHELLKKSIKYMFSFFCAGTPSERANLKLIDTLGVDRLKCQEISYRGDGWPGFTTIKDTTGKINKMTYEQSWGKILGRDVRKSCRFCMDGIGELADIACGDAWYLDENGKPDFKENSGRNIIFSRNEIGEYVLKKAIEAEYIYTTECEMDELKLIQTYQYERKCCMISMILAMKTMCMEIPNYKLKDLAQYMHFIPIKNILKRYLGTIRRIKKKAI